MAEEVVFFRKAELGGAEDIHADAPERFLTDGRLVVGKAAHDQAEHSVFTLFACRVTFERTEQGLIKVIMFDDDTERMQDRSDHLPVGRAEELFEIQKQLIQFARRQMQH